VGALERVYAAFSRRGTGFLAAPTPDRLQEIGTEARRKGLNQLSMREIDAEIATARRQRRRRTAGNTPAKRSGLFCPAIGADRSPARARKSSRLANGRAARRSARPDGLPGLFHAAVRPSGRKPGLILALDNQVKLPDN